MSDRKLKTLIKLSAITGLLFLPVTFSYATFYQSETLANYCREYVKYNHLDDSAKPLEAGICSGFVASTIELMTLSERLCKRNQLSLDLVIKQYIEAIENDASAKKNSASYVLVNVLQTNYACDDNS